MIISVELGVSFNNQSSQMPSLFITLHMAVNLQIWSYCLLSLIIDENPHTEVAILL